MFQWICHHYEDGWDPLRSPWESQYSSPLSCTFPPYHLRTFFFALFHMRLSLAHFSPRYHTKQPFLMVHDHIFQMIIARVPPNVKGRAKESRRLCVIRWCSCRPVYWSSTSLGTTTVVPVLLLEWTVLSHIPRITLAHFQTVRTFKINQIFWKVSTQIRRRALCPIFPDAWDRL